MVPTDPGLGSPAMSDRLIVKGAR
ncbi:uncharacterized protein METZ01_LOCUS113647, partial [marine metagenome]